MTRPQTTTPTQNVTDEGALKPGPAAPEREPGDDAPRHDRRETDPAFSPVGPQGGAAISDID